ncbi:MAG: SEC-C domain-containing protein, partial [Synergistaceae bacterium]|nr:SEC-C domain-containing protein [Synergistaceae bacterium]
RKMQAEKQEFITAAQRQEHNPHEPIKKGVKVGRNDPCPRGSGKKYKYCHGRGL